MPHIKNTYRYKNIIEVERVHSGRFGKRSDRGKRRLPTTEEMARINERNAINKLRRKIHANFEPGDLWMTLTYRREGRPGPGEARKELSRFLARLRTAYRRNGMELRYIIVTEYMNKSIHHHLILNDLQDGTGAKLAAGKWTRGGVNCKYLYEDGMYERLASYMVKETAKHFREPGNPAKCRYSCSRNLAEPKKETKVLKRDDWPDEPRAKGWILEKESLHNGINKLGYRYQYYRMFKPGGKGKGNGSTKRVHKNQQKGDAGDQKDGSPADRRKADRGL